MRRSLTWRRSLSGLLPAQLVLVGLLLLAAPSIAQADNSNGDMVVFGGQHETVREGQEVSGDLVVIGGSADVFGKVDGDAVAIGGRIYIAPSGHVDGSLVNVGGTIDNESNGTQGHHGYLVPPTPPSTETLPETDNRDWWLPFLFIDALLALVAFLLFPIATRNSADHLLDNPIMAGMLGFFSPLIFVLVIIALAITVVGIPLLPLAVILTFVGYLIGKAAIAEFLGGRIFEVTKMAQPKPILAVAVGLLVLTVVSALGWVGVVFYFCLMALALGASLYALLRTAQARRRMPPSVTPPAPPSQFSPPASQTPTSPPAVP